MTDREPWIDREPFRSMPPERFFLWRVLALALGLGIMAGLSALIGG
jgi:hypothetical protein